MENQKYKILVLGVYGVFGHKIFEQFSKRSDFKVFGTVKKSKETSNLFPENFRKNIIEGVFAERIETVEKILIDIKPDIVINAIGIIKQKENSKDIELMVKVNALFPHQLASICTKIGARMITFTTDCVFDGQKGESYFETDLPTCHDAYGMTKYLGEIRHTEHLTLRASIIGHELGTHLSLLDWFLYEPSKTVEGYTKAIFSGLTILELSKFLLEKIIDYPDIKGFYHLSVNPISKFDLLNLIAKKYGKDVAIIPNKNVVINRSLNSDILRTKVGYKVPEWDQLISEMHQDFLSSSFYKKSEISML